MDHSGPNCTKKTAEGYLRPYAEVCARRRAVSCTSRPSASFRTGIDGTACIGIETPGSDPLARWPRHKKRGKRVDAGDDAWRDPCNARRTARIRPSPWRTVDDGTCGPGVNAGDSRINQQDRPSAQLPKNSPDLPTAHIPDISKPSSVSDVEESPHVEWRHRMNASRVVT